MFFKLQTEEKQKKYELLLRIVAALSKLSSVEDSIPYLYYRMAEKIFCRAFSVKDLSRSDVSIDASKETCGIGLKTFLHRNGRSFEKIAEFNKESDLYNKLVDKPKDLILKIAELRNKRIEVTCGICSVSPENLIYHCVTRAESVLYLHEEQMHLINIENIRVQKAQKNTISFTDGIGEYNFNISKSTLFKRFNIESIYEISVKIFDNPFDLLEKYLSNEFQEDTSNKIVDTIYLPLYSYKNGRKYVPCKSGLNQWNAQGRKRDPNEVYICIPKRIRQLKRNFFPLRDEDFTLNLPNGLSKKAKVCQDGDKALMTNPNKDLGKWILRDILKIKEGELVTYEMLEEIGIDAVKLNKFEDGTYEINFTKIGSYETYCEEEEN